MNIICIKIISSNNLKLLDNQLKTLSETYEIEYQKLKFFKKVGFYKVWIDLNTEGGEIIGSQFKGKDINIETAFLGKVTKEQLFAIQPVKNPKREGEDEPEILIHQEIVIEKVICISLKSHNEQQLDAIGATYNISWEFLCEMKKKGGKKLWIHKDAGFVIAGLDTDNPDDVYFSPEYLPITAKLRKAILAIKPVKTPKMPKWAKDGNMPDKFKTANPETAAPLEIKSPENTEYNVDEILDKISAQGLQSLTPGERKFLESLGDK